MKLARLTLEHFKILDRAEFDLAPITILIGGNNAGKSTALQALTLLAQSAGGVDVATRGQYIDLGPSSSALINRSSTVGDGWSVEVGWDESHSGDHPVAPNRPLRISFKCTAGIPGLAALTEGIVQFEAPTGRAVTVRAWPSAVGPRFEIDAEAWGQQAGLSESVRDLISTGVFGMLPYPEGAGQPGDFQSEEAVRDPIALGHYAQAVGAPYFALLIHHALGMIRYLGVDRHFDQSVFTLLEQQPTLPLEQHSLASVLAYARDIRSAVDKRCREMFGFGVSADFAQGRNVDLVATAANGDTFSLSNMGAGFGQLVWIAVYLEQLRAGVSSPVTPILGLEEPELHLHPALQPAMARMLASYAKDGIQQLLTTQSEHLLIAFLQLVTSGELQTEDLAVYHLDGGRVERLGVDKLGRLSGGLKGFFEANENELLEQLEALIRASSE